MNRYGKLPVNESQSLALMPIVNLQNFLQVPSQVFCKFVRKFLSYKWLDLDMYVPIILSSNQLSLPLGYPLVRKAIMGGNVN